MLSECCVKFTKSVFLCPFLFIADWDIDMMSGAQEFILDDEGEACVWMAEELRQKEPDILGRQVSSWMLISKNLFM